MSERLDLPQRATGDPSALVTEHGWALARVRRMQGMAETNAGVYGAKLLRGRGYPDIVMTDAMDALALRTVLAEREWQPVETVPRDGTVVLRPHRIWGAMDVRYITETDAVRVSVLANGIKWCWLNGDYTTAWTESAFMPYWMPLPPPPAEAR